MYSKIMEIKRGKQIKKTSIKKADSTVAMEMDEVKERLKVYIQELFRDQIPDTLNLSTNDDGTIILKSVVNCAMRSMKKGKAVGNDGEALEMISALRVFGVNELTKLFNKIYASGNIIEYMCESVFNTLPKVEGTLECKDHRTISIMSQVTKKLLRIILKRVRSKKK